MGMPSSSATARTSSGATMLALSGPLENTITTLRPGTLAASRRSAAGRCRARYRRPPRICAGRRWRRSFRASGGGAREVPAERVDRDGIGAVQAAHEIGDGVLGVHEPLYMKLLVSKSTNTLVPTNASGFSMPGSGSARGVESGRVVPSAATATGVLAPSAKVEIFCGMPSSKMRKSPGLRPLM